MIKYNLSNNFLKYKNKRNYLNKNFKLYQIKKDTNDKNKKKIFNEYLKHSGIQFSLLSGILIFSYILEYIYI